ncbi:hypothetical protein LUZ62_040256 [Rhynchospora pubera]|uniref:Uncharacterized protein n=1 Tax=Rhynchospora pubera TaxID=906938 RepID=A0AAV8F9P0_9POAL|nr:hypothetical protein LUZ62_040256 [Rhynchospora pubera]
MVADKIRDHSETTQIDSVDDSSARTNREKKRITFYFVKYYPYEDPEITCKIKEACCEIQKKTKEIEYCKKELKRYEEEEKRATYKLQYWDGCHKGSISSIHLKREYLFHVRNAVDKSSTDYRVAMQSPEVKKLANHIGGLKHRVQKEKLTLKEEKQLIKLMDELKAEKDEVVAVVSVNNKERQNQIVNQYLAPSYKYKKVPMEKWPQYITEEIDRMKAHQLNSRKQMRYYENYLEDIKNHITKVQQNINTAISERDQTDKMLHKSKELAAKLNACYYENNGLRDSAKHLGAAKDIAALDDLSNIELEKFFSQWNANEAVRNDYTRRVLLSLDCRGLSEDGRIGNPDEGFSTVRECSVPWPRAVCK